MSPFHLDSLMVNIDVSIGPPWRSDQAQFRWRCLGFCRSIITSWHSINHAIQCAQVLPLHIPPIPGCLLGRSHPQRASNDAPVNSQISHIKSRSRTELLARVFSQRFRVWFLRFSQWHRYSAAHILLVWLVYLLQASNARERRSICRLRRLFANEDLLEFLREKEENGLWAHSFDAGHGHNGLTNVMMIIVWPDSDTYYRPHKEHIKRFRDLMALLSIVNYTQMFVSLIIRS